MFKTIEYESQGPLALIRLNRPEKLNAVNAVMVAELNQSLDRAEADEAVRVIVLSGNGRAFSAGFDLEETDRYAIEPMVGWGSYEELRAGLGFEMLGIFGSGFDLNAKGTVSAKGHRVVASLSDPQFWPSLLGYRTSFSIAADNFRREEPSFVDGAVG